MQMANWVFSEKVERVECDKEKDYFRKKGQHKTQQETLESYMFIWITAS